MSRNHDTCIKKLETQISQLSRQITYLPSSSEGFSDNTVDNPKNKSCKDVETCVGVIAKKEKDEIVEEGIMEKEELRKEREDNEFQGNQE